MTTPTDDQIDELWDEIGGYFNLYPEVRNTVREALNRWGTLEPIALEDREPPKSIEELQQEFENTLEDLSVKTKRKFAASKESAEYRFKIKSDQANSRFEYAKKNGEFLQYLSLTTSSNVRIDDSNVFNSYLSVSNSALSGGTEFNLNPSKNSVGYYFVEPDVKFHMTKRPNRIVQFFMRNLLGFNWRDKK
jgi:hypothetical protein